MSFLSKLFSLNDVLEESPKYQNLIERIRNYPLSWSSKLNESEIGQEILNLKINEQIEFVMVLIKYLSKTKRSAASFTGEQITNDKGETRYVSVIVPPSNWTVEKIFQEMLKLKLPYDHDHIKEILIWASDTKRGNYDRSIPQIIKIIERYLKENKITHELKKDILNLVEVIREDIYQGQEYRKQSFKLLEIAGLNEVKFPIIEGEAWSDAAIADISKFDDETKTNWIQFLNECQKANGSKPTAKWLKSANALIEKIGFEEFKSHILKWFPLVDKPRTQQVENWSQWSPNPNLMLNDVNADILKGLVWVCGLREDKDIARTLTNLAISVYKKVPQIGPRCVRVGNACVWALGQMGMEGVGQLAILKLKVKFGTAQKLIGYSLQETAIKVGLSADELEEMSVPDYGLTEVGFFKETFGDFAAELVVTGTNSAETRWFNSDGKQQKSVPKFVKENFSEELKELTNSVKDIKKMLPVQRDRIENLYLEEKHWDCKIWRERYLDHPLIGTIARRLIWRFDEATTAVFLDGKLVDNSGDELTVFEDSKVELWHPLHSSTAEVLRWREFLETHEIVQPFKQAHREIYVLTDAERNTDVYSNRFAAHIIRQHQFNALCGQRNWKNQLRIMADADFHAPMRSLPKHGLRAEFWVEAIGDEYGVDSNETGTYYYLATDQVRFYPQNAPLHYGHGYGGGYWEGYGNNRQIEPLALDKIPPLVFSEIMRDVDMFVGVCSIGNDPNWTDGGRETRHHDYWYDYSFGDLSATAKTRKEILERLIPRLKIASKSSFEDKFLIVKGDLRTYKIHLGSGNILMSPNDQYLCIVPSANTEKFGQGKVFLPFEGDRLLSIILSKAFMLAEDTKITDPTIIRQIKS
jgi:hypothetical protein